MTQSHIWLALHLPFLPLEARAPYPSPSAVTEQGRILIGDEAARQSGIEPGMSVAGARALSPRLNLLARDRGLENATLQALACWGGQFTPRVSLTCDTVLLEVGSCLRLFGGLRKLSEKIVEKARPLYFTLTMAAAPTPLAAQWLAQQGKTVLCDNLAYLSRLLGQLPVSVLSTQAAEALQRFGAETLGEVRRLPSTQLARRIGAESMRHLAQAFGEAPDLRSDFIFPDRFSLSLQLPAVVEHAAALVFASRRLLCALAGWLSHRQAGVRSMNLRLRHERGETPLALQFADLTADSTRFERVMRERLERLELAAPVDSLCLEASEVAPLGGRNGTLFNDACAEQDDIHALLERLSARFGEEGVYRLTTRDQHRPECATHHATLQEKLLPEETFPLPRPLWLLTTPEILREVDGRPFRNGPLELMVGPERIESGWWGNDEIADPGDIRRDYFIAHTPDERWLWIYRECREPGGWFLHGYFS